mmetsp:Transcript_117998/g.208612  ORF Transcript_117998/g.208612 Transcript_117998/m.208612 type:complete len:265 (+) Transcript_117998:77-871(+)
MNAKVLVLTCLACAGHATPSSQSKLATLLMAQNPAAFNPSSPMEKPISSSSRARLGSSRPVVGRSSVVKSQGGVGGVVDPTAAVPTEEELEDEEIPPFAVKDFLTVKAERWNGRHAMFGWFAIAVTAYIKTHGGFPEGDKLLTYAEWGSLTQTGFGGSVTNERAIILIAHVHLLLVSIASALSPPGMITDPIWTWQDEEPEEPYGLFPPFPSVGLTPAVEMWNGRMAMVGISAAVICSYITGKDIFEVIDVCTGGLFLSGKDIR